MFVFSGLYGVFYYVVIIYWCNVCINMNFCGYVIYCEFFLLVDIWFIYVVKVSYFNGIVVFCCSKIESGLIGVIKMRFCDYCGEIFYWVNDFGVNICFFDIDRFNYLI